MLPPVAVDVRVGRENDRAVRPIDQVVAGEPERDRALAHEQGCVHAPAELGKECGKVIRNEAGVEIGAAAEYAVDLEPGRPERKRDVLELCLVLAVPHAAAAARPLPAELSRKFCRCSRTREHFSSKPEPSPLKSKASRPGSSFRNFDGSMFAARPDTDQSCASPRPSLPRSATRPPRTLHVDSSTAISAVVKRPVASPANGGPPAGSKSPLRR